jgi:hypothetical protein
MLSERAQLQGHRIAWRQPQPTLMPIGRTGLCIPSQASQGLRAMSRIPCSWVSRPCAGSEPTAQATWRALVYLPGEAMERDPCYREDAGGLNRSMGPRIADIPI